MGLASRGQGQQGDHLSGQVGGTGGQGPKGARGSGPNLGAQGLLGKHGKDRAVALAQGRLAGAGLGNGRRIREAVSRVMALWLG